MSVSEFAELSVTCQPGTASTPFVKELLRGHWVLSMPFRPVGITIAPEFSAEGRAEMARWCRELSRVAAGLAATLETAARPRLEQAEDLRRLTGDDDSGGGANGKFET